MIKKASTTAAAMAAVAVFLSPLRAPASPADEKVVQWAVDQMARWSPPDKLSAAETASGYPETEAEARSRFAKIAAAARDVAFDPKEPPVFQGPDARSRTMAVMLAIASIESGGFQKKTDLGIGDGVGDGGKSWCLMQVRLSTKNAATGKTWYRVVLDDKYWSYAVDGVSGWGGEDLVADRHKCFRAGLHAVRGSFDKLASRPLEDRLAVYASGKITAGFVASRRRMERAVSWLAKDPAPEQDAAVLELLHPAASS